ncbi:MAG: bile acid:sodium symporter [Actinomycetota bacterium]
MPEDLKTVFNVLVLVFVLSTMFSLGLGLTAREIVAPLRNRSLLARSVAVNFVVSPALAYGIARAVGLERDLGIGLFILGVAAGSPMTIKVVQIAKGDMAYTAGLMVLLQVLTIAVAPLTLTLLIDDVAVDVLGLTQAMAATMLLPLGLGLAVNARYGELGRHVAPYVKQATSITLVLQAGLGLAIGIDDFLDLLGTGTILALILFVLILLAVGHAGGGPSPETRTVTSLVASQRNTSAALLITIQNFAEPSVIVMVITGAALMLIIGSIAAGELGRRAADRTAAERTTPRGSNDDPPTGARRPSPSTGEQS